MGLLSRRTDVCLSFHSIYFRPSDMIAASLIISAQMWCFIRVLLSDLLTDKSLCLLLVMRSSLRLFFLYVVTCCAKCAQKQPLPQTVFSPASLWWFTSDALKKWANRSRWGLFTFTQRKRLAKWPPPNIGDWVTTYFAPFSCLSRGVD